MDNSKQINICLIGVGYAGYSHFINLFFDNRFNIVSVIDTNKANLDKIKSYSKDIECYNHLNEKFVSSKSIDIYLISVPPIELFQLLINIKDDLAVIDKPGIILSNEFSNKHFFYSRHQYNYYSLIKRFLSGIKEIKQINYENRFHFKHIYEKGDTYLNKKTNSGVVLDTACHFIEMISLLLPKVRVIKYTPIVNKHKIEYSCKILLKKGQIDISIRIIDDNYPCTNRWVLGINNIIIEVGEQNYILDGVSQKISPEKIFFNELVRLFNKQSNFFVHSSHNNLILELINNIYKRK